MSLQETEKELLVESNSLPRGQEGAAFAPTFEDHISGERLLFVHVALHTLPLTACHTHPAFARHQARETVACFFQNHFHDSQGFPSQ